MARQMRKIHENIHAETDVNESALGDSLVQLTKRLIRTKTKVIKSPILPAAASGGTTKLI